MFYLADILSKLRALGAPAKFLQTVVEQLPLGQLETEKQYLLVGPGHILTSDSGAQHQGHHNYYVLPLSMLPTPLARRAA